MNEMLPPFPDPGRARSARRLKLDDRVDRLAGLALFEGWSKRDLRNIARNTREEMIEPDQFLIREGSPAREAYVIIGGEAVVRSKGRRLAALGPGDIVGELGLLLHRPRTASVQALTPLEYLVLEQANLKDCVERSPHLGWLLLQTVANRLSDTVT